MKSLCTLGLLLLTASLCRAQRDTLNAQMASARPAAQAIFSNKKVQVGTGLTVAFGGSLVALNQAWYRQYQSTSFQTFDDSREWLQIDKAGHNWAAYQLARSTAPLWQWSGMPERKAVLWSSAGSMAYLTLIELMDAHSQKWGWSWTDLAANTSGVLLYAGQQLGWQEQRIQFKFSVAPQRYPAAIAPRAADLFGVSFPERVLKDYNAQTYWLSFNLHAFLSQSKLPAWLNVAVGYGADGMLGGFRNEAFDKFGNRTFYRPDIHRVRQWYLAPDVDFTKIKTNRKGVRTLLFALNCLKMPTPALMLEQGKVRLNLNPLSP